MNMEVELPVIPQEIADYIESEKAFGKENDISCLGNIFYDALEFGDPTGWAGWIYDHEREVALAYLVGYTIK